MGTKRKASQIDPLTTEPQVRRSKRNTGVLNGEQTKKEVINVGIHEIKSVSAIKTSATNNADTKQTKSTKEATKPIKSVKQTAKAIINEKIDFYKDVIPIRTYGRSNNISQASDNQKQSIAPTKTVIVQSIKSKTATTKPTTKSDPVDKIQPASKVIKKKNDQAKKKGNLNLISPTQIEIRTNNANVKSVQSPTVSNVEAGGRKIIINKIIMPPDAYNQMIKQNPNQPTDKKIVTTTAPSTIKSSSTVTNQVPVQLFNNLQTNLGQLGPLVLSSGIKMMPNQQILVTNPSSVLKTTNMPINIPINQINQLANNNQLRIISSPTQLQTQPGQIKHLQLPIIIKSIVNPMPVQQTVTNTNVQTITTANTNSATKVNPITNVVKPVPISKAVPLNKSPDKVVVNIDTNKKDTKQVRKTRVSFNFEKNTSTSIKPISNDLPITASNVLLTSTPKQSIIKKPKVFELPCTPIVNSIIGRRSTGITRQQNAAANKVTAGNKQETVSNQQKKESTSEQTVKKSSQQTVTSSNGKQNCLSSKYCEANQCDCYSNIPKDDLQNVKKEYQSLNAPKKMLYIYCTTIRLDKEANFDFEKYAFYVRTKNGFVQVCHRVFLEIYEKNNLTFVDTAFRKFHV